MNEALKIYWISTHLDIEPSLVEKPVLEDWLGTFKILLKKDIGPLSHPLGENEDEKTRGNHPWW